MERKLATIVKTSWAPFDIQKSKVHVVDKHLAKVGCTCFLKVFFTNVGNIYSMKIFLLGSSPSNITRDLIYGTK
jgi:hypothetical protein